MSQKKKKEDLESQTDLTILEAVENLTNIAEMDGGERIGLIEDHLIVHDQDEEDEELSLEAINWLEEKSQHKTEAVVESTFKAVLNYVEDFHKKEIHRFYEEKNQEGIKKMMLLVGKASDKLKSFTHLFSGESKEGVEGIREYKQLTNFYKERIAIEEDDKVSLIDLSRKDRQIELVRHPLEEEDENFLKAKQFILDIEKIKTDDSYELLFIQRDDGTRFYNQDFYKNLKLACNFGDFASKHVERDPLEGLVCWFDQSLHKSAQKILLLLQPHLKLFYQEAMKYKEMEIVSSINKAVMALMMASNPKNKLELEPQKPSGEYFLDFQRYLRESLESFEYHKLKSFPPPSSNVFLNNMMDIIHLLSWSLFFHHLDVKSLSVVLDDIVEEGKVSSRKKGKSKAKKQSLWSDLEEMYLHISRYLMAFPIGPLFKTLNAIQDGNVDGFDTLMMKNIPLEWLAIQMNGKKISLLKLPTPTNQEIISKVRVDEEFVGLLDALKETKIDKKHLIINLQNRTNWQESPRARLLEKLPKTAEHCETVDVVTLCKDSDFYYQRGAYEKMESIGHFFKQIIFQMHSEETGFYFPGWVEEKIFSGFIEKLISQIHKFFFDSKSKLDVKERQDFIEIVYQFLTLKLLESVDPTSFSFTCKDGVDVGAVSMCQLFSFIKAIQGEEINQEEQAKMNMLLFAFPLIYRQRCVQADRFNRMIQCQRRIERGIEKHTKTKVQERMKDYFGMLYEFSFDELTFKGFTLDQLIKEKE